LRGYPAKSRQDRCTRYTTGAQLTRTHTLEEIGDYVGHASSHTTDRYRHLIDGQRDQAAAKLDALLETSI
jgi:hypothetical protein